ncbi:hypothetical protein AN641_00870 [Candidatus Epulonipiscioides gigas]|nr:hypothetical protein AN641_00870 [Epulopiscium sp. SCG-C07WGA-EpuloA2]
MLPQSSTLDTDKLEEALTKRLPATYKLFWFRAILMVLEEANNIYLFVDISHNMILAAWDYVGNSKIKFPSIDKLPELILTIQSRYPDVTKDNLTNFLERLKKEDKDIKIKVKHLVSFAPYRFLVPFLEYYPYKLTTVNTHKHIEQSANLSNNVIYKFFCDMGIQIDFKWHQYLNQNKITLIKYVDELIAEKIYL